MFVPICRAEFFMSRMLGYSEQTIVRYHYYFITQCGVLFC
jgi:hypothetical protein